MSTWPAKRLSNLVIVMWVSVRRRAVGSRRARRIVDPERAGGKSTESTGPCPPRVGLCRCRRESFGNGKAGGTAQGPGMRTVKGFAGRKPWPQQVRGLEGGQALGGGVGQVARGSAGDL